MPFYVSNPSNTTTKPQFGAGSTALKQSTAVASAKAPAPILPTQPAEAGQQIMGEASWHHFEIAGRRFQVSSHRSDSHMQEVEKLLVETYTQVQESLNGKQPLHAALLTAMNLADQLVSQAQGHQAKQSNLRMESLLSRLEKALIQHSE